MGRGPGERGPPPRGVPTLVHTRELYQCELSLIPQLSLELLTRLTQPMLMNQKGEILVCSSSPSSGPSNDSLLGNLWEFHMEEN